MKTMGFPISNKNNEKRRALLPSDILNIKEKSYLYFEEGYGNVLGINDIEYIKAGANIASRLEVLSCDIITDVKIGDSNYLDNIKNNKILFGWGHVTQNINFTTKMLESNHTVIAWEEMFEDGRYVFYRNREIAGEAAILQAYLYCGKMPYETKVCIIGNGQTAKGALRILHGLGANVDVYNRKLECLFKKKMFDYDVVVNCVLWDTSRKDRLIYKDDLKKFKKGTLIIDISCDPNLEIETSRPTTIDNPIFIENDIIHYCVDNTPAMFPFTATSVISNGLYKYIDMLITGNYSQTIDNAIVIKEGIIIDEKTIKFRQDKGLFIK